MKRISRPIIVPLLLLILASAVEAQPVITSINSSELPRSGRVAIEGSGFGTDGEVFIAELSAWTTTWTDTRIVAYVPEAALLGPTSLLVSVPPAVKSNEVPLTVTARQADGRVKWSFEADGSNLWWRPALAPDGTIYVHTNNSTDGLVYALSPDGGLLWVENVNWAPYVPPSAGPDGAVYVGSIGRIYRIAPEGIIDWEFRDPGSPGPRVAPTIGPDGLLYGAFDVGIGAFAMEPLTGELVWSNTGAPRMTDKSGEATEMKFGPSGPGEPVDQLYVSMDGGAGFYAFSLDGDQLFTASLGNLSGTAEAAIGSDGTIYGPRATGLVVAALDPSDGTTLWEYFPGPSEWAVGTDNVEIGPDNMLYFVGSTAKLEAFDPQTQSRRWQAFTPGVSLDRPTVTPDGSVLILASTDTNVFGNPGFVRAFDAGNGRELWSLDLPFQLNPGFRVYGTHHPRITPDGTTAYLSTLTLAEWPLSTDPHSFLYAIDVTSGGGGPPPENQPPVARASATPTVGEAPLLVNFDSSGSSDPDGVITASTWDFGDGNSSTSPNPAHTYATPGTFVATLTVTDDAGATGSDAVTITATAPGACSVNCLRSTDIALSARARKGTVTITGNVKVQDETGAKMQNANVDATWTLPDGMPSAQMATTNQKGEAKFTVAGGSGTYTLTVTGMSKLGFAFDPDNSVLSNSITK